MPLVDVRITKTVDPIAAMIAEMNSQSAETKHLMTGVYEIGHWNPEFVTPDINHNDWGFNPGPDHGAYGVCDTPEQAIEILKLNEHPEKLVMFMVPIVKANQSPEGGWRWHKWGEYIGIQEPTCEYLYNEPLIEKVYTYHVYRVRN